MPSDETREEVVPLEADLLLRAESWDEIAAAIEALGPTSDGYTESSRDDDKHILEGRLRAWGWWGDLWDQTDTGHGQSIRLRGLYGDWSWLVDDEKLMPALAPFAPYEGRIIFQDVQGARYNSPTGIRAWVFKDGAVALHDVEQETVFHING